MELGPPDIKGLEAIRPPTPPPPVMKATKIMTTLTMRVRAVTFYLSERSSGSATHNLGPVIRRPQIEGPYMHTNLVFQWKACLGVQYVWRHVVF